MSNGPHFSVELTDLSIFESAPAQVSNSDSRWHPKITLYRLSFISTTICLGSAKAVETSHGKSYVSTTIEWIAGVVVFILLFVAGWFEEDSSKYPKLAWLVDCDLVRLIWSPSYTSEERQRINGAYPLFTTYRLLVSGTALMFGMLKASLSYAGHGGAANVFDWIFGVVVTSTLYVLGLYEYNPANMMPYLFETHYDDQFYSARLFFSGIVLYLVGLAFTLLGAWVWSFALEILRYDLYKLIDNGRGFPTSLSKRHAMNLWFAAVCFGWLVLLAIIVCSLYCLWKIVWAFGRLDPFRKLAKLLHPAFLRTRTTVSRPFGGFDVSTWAEGIVRFVKDFGVHILFYMVPSVLFLFGALEFFDLMGRVETITDGDTIFLALGYGFLGIVTCAIAVFSIVQVLLPFFQIIFPRLRPSILCVGSDIDEFSDAEPSSGTMNPKELDSPSGSTRFAASYNKKELGLPRHFWTSAPVFDALPGGLFGKQKSLLATSTPEGSSSSKWPYVMVDDGDGEQSEEAPVVKVDRKGKKRAI